MTRVPAERPGNRFLVGATDFSLVKNVQTNCVVHTTSHSLSSGVYSLQVKEQEHEADHSLLLPRLRRDGKISVPPYAFMVCGGTDIVRSSNYFQLIVYISLYNYQSLF